MSGGSFNYLYAQEPYDPEELERMAAWLDEHEMHLAAFQTRALIPVPRAGEALADLWQAVEWLCSSDWGFDQVIEAHNTYLKAVVPESERWNPNPDRWTKEMCERVGHDDIVMMSTIVKYDGGVNVRCLRCGAERYIRGEVRPS